MNRGWVPTGPIGPPAGTPVITADPPGPPIPEDP